jgi:hypothetical protein
VYFSIYFAYCFVFLYRKDTNPVLKYPVFIKTLQYIIKQKNIFCFDAYGQVSQRLKKKKSYPFFIRKTQKN